MRHRNPDKELLLTQETMLKQNKVYLMAAIRLANLATLSPLPSPRAIITLNRLVCKLAPFNTDSGCSIGIGTR